MQDGIMVICFKINLFTLRYKIAGISVLIVPVLPYTVIVIQNEYYIRATMPNSDSLQYR